MKRKTRVQLEEENTRLNRIVFSLEEKLKFTEAELTWRTKVAEQLLETMLAGSREASFPRRDFR